MRKISFDATEMETAVAYTEQLACMSNALHIAMFEGPHSASN